MNEITKNKLNIHRNKKHSKNKEKMQKNLFNVSNFI